MMMVHLPLTYLAPEAEAILQLPRDPVAASGGSVDLDGQGLDFDFGGDW